MPTSEILPIIIWPIVALIVALAFMFGFRKSINQLINRLQKTKLPGGAEVEFGSGEALKRVDEKKYLEESKELIPDSATLISSISDKSDAGQSQEGAKSEVDEQDWFFFYRQNDHEKARELLLVEIGQQQDAERVQLLRAIAADMLSYYDFNGAVAEFENLIGEYPTNDSMYSSYSWTYLNRNLSNEAIAVVDRGISRIKNSDYLVLRKAQILEQCQRYDEALAIANEKIKLKGKLSSKFYCLIARIQKALGQENEARAAYVHGYESDPADLEVIREVANYFYQLNDYQMEFFFRKQAINLDNKNSSDWSLLGNCYLSLGLNNLSMCAYEEADKLAEGKQAWIVANIGNLLNNVGLYSKAIAEFSKSLELGSSSQYAHERLSRAMASKDKEDQKAKEILETSKKVIEGQLRPE